MTTSMIAWYSMTRTPMTTSMIAWHCTMRIPLTTSTERERAWSARRVSSLLFSASHHLVHTHRGSSVETFHVISIVISM